MWSDFFIFPKLLEDLQLAFSFDNMVHSMIDINIALRTEKIYLDTMF